MNWQTEEAETLRKAESIGIILENPEDFTWMVFDEEHETLIASGRSEDLEDAKEAIKEKLEEYG